MGLGMRLKGLGIETSNGARNETQRDRVWGWGPSPGSSGSRVQTLPPSCRASAPGSLPSSAARGAGESAARSSLGVSWEGEEKREREVRGEGGGRGRGGEEGGGQRERKGRGEKATELNEGQV